MYMSAYGIVPKHGRSVIMVAFSWVARIVDPLQEFGKYLIYSFWLLVIQGVVTQSLIS